MSGSFRCNIETEFRTMIVLCFCALVLRSLRRQSLHFSQAQCTLFQKEVTCEGTGTLTVEDVQAAGPYTTFESIIVKSGITRLGDACFQDCAAVRSITLPDSVTHYGSTCFAGTRVTTFFVSRYVTSMGGYPWNGGTSLTKFEVDSGNENYASYEGVIYNKAYSNVMHIPGALTNLVFHDSARVIDASAMRWQQKIVDLVIGSKITTVGKEAFYGSNMKTVYVPKSVSDLHPEAFSGCMRLEKIILEAGSEYYYHEGGIFGKKTNGVKKSIIWIDPTTPSAHLDANILTDGSGFAYQTFTFAGALKKVTSSHSTFKVDSSEQFIIKSTTTVIACVGGAEIVTIPNTITIIDWNAFRGCKFLHTVTLGTKVTTVRGSSFRDCPKLAIFDFANTAPAVGSFTYATSGHTTFKRWTGVTVLPESVFQTAYQQTLDMKHIVRLDKQAFFRCNYLQEVIFRDVTTIGPGCFSECPMLTTVDMKLCTKLKTIGSTAFTNCKSLESLILPGSVENIQASSFAYNKKLTSITFHSESANYQSLDGVVYSKNLKTLIVCPSGLDRIEVHSQADTIGYNAFYGCMNLVDVVMRDNILKIEAAAFFDCSRIEFIRLPASLKTIGSRAVESCGRLRKILYCNNTESAKTQHANEDPFPTNPEIWVFYDYKSRDGKFLGHPVTNILDYNCNIPTMYFTEMPDSEAQTVYVSLFLPIIMATELF